MPSYFSKEALTSYLPIDNIRDFVQSNKHLSALNDQLNDHLTKSNLLKLFGISFAGLSVAYLIKIWWAYQFFKRRGIKTPKYRFFFGNHRELKKNNYSEVIKEWTKQLGPTYGIFQGHYPELITSDLEIIQEVFIKQYSNFSARRLAPLADHDDDPSVNLIQSTKLRWKRMRNIMNPTFSTSKLKELSPLMLKCVDRMIEKIGEHENEEINVSETLKRFTMDTIWNCAFGLDINVQNDKSYDMYFQKCEQFFQDLLHFPLIFYFGVYFHELKSVIFKMVLLISNFKMNSEIGVIWLRKKIHEIVEARLAKKTNRNDYIKLLLDAHTTESIEDLKKNNTALTSTHLEKKLSMEEIDVNLVLFMLAGYETTSTTLTYISFILARYPEEQEILYNEIMNHFPDTVEPEIDTVSKCEYMDMFVKEVLRLYPIAIQVVNRRCTKRTTIKGIDMPIGLNVAVDVLSVHYDPAIWGPVDPNAFYPKRFSPEYKRHPLAFMGFGIGPRNCIGMKFAYQELKFALVKLLKRFEVLPGPHTPTKLEIVEGGVRSPKGGMSVIFKKRN